MSYLVMARKYRPRTFSEVLGQGPIITTLTNAIKQKKIGQAYLFAGPRGTGKTSTARIFAKALNCEKGPTATPCLKCKRCEEIAEGRSLDVLEIDGASNRGIDQIRSLRELAKFSPATGTYKVYIIDEVHQITSEGFNALLKTLEEPPPHLLFIMATTALHKVPATILSRCQRFEFKRLPMKLITEKLKNVAADEKLKIADEAVAGIARAASGSLRDAESILDQVAAFAGGAIKGEDVHTLLGTLQEDLFVEAMEGIQARDPVRLLKLVAGCADGGVDLVPWALGLLSFVRNVLVAKVGAGSLWFEELEPESVKKLAELAGKFPVEELIEIGERLAGAVETMRRVGEPRIPLEMALVRLSSSGSKVRVADLVARLEKLDQRLRSGGSPPPPTFPVRAEPVEARTEAPPFAAPTPPASSDLEKIVSVWPALLEQLHQKKAATAGHLTHGQPVSVKPGDPPELVIGFAKGQEFSCRALEQIATRQLIETCLAELAGHPIRCAFQVVADLSQPAAANGPATPAPKPDSAYLSNVLELFEGRMLPGEG